MQQSNSIGKTCPYCITTITEDSDAVFCSICEMPHHKECWIENKGCTTFGCMGTMVGGSNTNRSTSQAKSQGSLFCSKCGTTYEAGQKFCVVCGAMLTAPSTAARPTHADLPPIDIEIQSEPTPVSYQQPQYGAQAGYQAGAQAGSEQDLILFLSSNQPYYLQQFHAMKVKATNTSWNWCGFLFSVYWMGYRKMYKLAAIYLGVYTILSMIPVVGPLVLFGVSIATGIFVNHLYLQYVEEELRMARTLDQSQAALYIQKKGGTSIGGMFAVIGIYFVVLLIFYAAAM